MTTEPRNADEPVTMADLAHEELVNEQEKAQKEPEPRVVHVLFRDGSVNDIKVDSETFTSVAQDVLYVFKYMVDEFGRKHSKNLIIAIPIEIVRSWQIIRPGEQPIATGPSIRRIVKFSGLAGEVPVGTIVEWMGDEVPCGWREVKK